MRHNYDSHVSGAGAGVANAGLSIREVSVMLGRCINPGSASFYWSLIEVATATLNPSLCFIPSLLLFLLSRQLFI